MSKQRAQRNNSWSSGKKKKSGSRFKFCHAASSDKTLRYTSENIQAKIPNRSLCNVNAAPLRQKKDKNKPRCLGGGDFLTLSVSSPAKNIYDFIVCRVVETLYMLKSFSM